jgi:aminoglycoside 2'-N-acetyltransferase I
LKVNTPRPNQCDRAAGGMLFSCSTLGSWTRPTRPQSFWPRCDGCFSDEDWAHTVGGRHVVVADNGIVVAHAAVVPRVLDVGGRPFHTGYLEGVATAPGRQREGIGSIAMTQASAVVRRDFELGALSTGRHAFYERLGWERWQGPTWVRRGTELVRTEDEDDGVMVLRFGPSNDIDRTAPITCEARSGDDW